MSHAHLLQMEIWLRSASKEEILLLDRINISVKSEELSTKSSCCSDDIQY